MGARQPPTPREKPSRIVLKMIVVAILASGVGVLIWNLTTEQRIDLIESNSIVGLGLDPAVLVTGEGVTLYAVDRTDGQQPVVILHDVDVSGSVPLDDLVDAMDDDLRVATIDLPGFGLSQRIPESGTPHTVAAMARAISSVVEMRYSEPVVFVGVGLGGEVAAEIAATRQELVSGLVMVDVDFWGSDRWRQRSPRLPWIGRAMTFTFETSGMRSLATWAPHCEEGGWCPTADQQARRRVTAEISDSTRSIHAFRNTPRSSFVPSDLDQISAPTVYVWSTDGDVAEDSVERMGAQIAHMTVTEVDVWQAHLERPETVAAAVTAVIDR